MASRPESSSPPPKSGLVGEEDKGANAADSKDLAILDTPFTSEGSGSDEEFEEDLAKNPFLDPDVAAHWRGVYESAEYECRHAFDPTVTWSEEEERKLVRKLDFRICTWACVMFFALQVDRGNLTQALSDNMLDDLGLNTNDYNLGNITFLLAFLFAELPSQLVSKKLGPDRWIPVQMVLWSVVAISQCAITGRSSFLATRALLGLLEGGFIPDIVLWLSYFYTSRELPIRLSYFWMTLSLTTIITSLLAFALLHLRGVHGWAGWRWLFLVEGLITLTIGLLSFFNMPASAVQTKTWFRPKGWFNDREITVLVNRVLRDDPSKGDMHNREAITPRRLWEVLKDYDLWPMYAIGLVSFIPQTPVDKYLTLILRSVGFDQFTTNLLTIPATVGHIICLLIITRISEYLNERALVGMMQNVWILPCVIALRFWPGLINNAWGTYALVSVLLAYPYCHAINVAWVSKNANNVGSRTVASALYNISVQLGNICASFAYQDYDKPYYHDGNTKLIAIDILAILTFIVAKVYYVWRNKQKEKTWKSMSEPERIEYTRYNKTKGSKRLDFRFAH
ncbi:major facilitator superfamily domain-containing protein [Dichotomopilus funicola]|uniref:Major facilitator superfamily domain-containing protein n=1 Tax=Dichotomopilus funicola TaxID=1934379 RepID=A0AAN6ZNV2_9PEZI|nr:major facilitator superfamily domain-containing protein [Dichotomopilus funicola]